MSPLESLCSEAQTPALSLPFANSSSSPLCCFLSPTFWRCPFFCFTNETQVIRLFATSTELSFHESPSSFFLFPRKKMIWPFFLTNPPPWRHLTCCLNDSLPLPSTAFWHLMSPPLTWAPTQIYIQCSFTNCSLFEYCCQLSVSLFCLQTLWGVDSTYCVHFLPPTFNLLLTQSYLRYYGCGVHSSIFFWSPMICYWPYWVMFSGLIFFFPATLPL